MKKPLMLLATMPLLCSCGYEQSPVSTPNESDSTPSFSSEVSSEPLQSESEEKEIFCLNITKNPAKRRYFSGETFDSTGMEVEAEYMDGSKRQNVPFRVLTKTPLSRESKIVSFTYGGVISSLKVEVTSNGNREEYSVANTPALASSLIAGKKLFFLGSSVTYGAASGGEAMSDYLDKRDGTISVKEAVSGTSLADITSKDGGLSYVARFEAYINNHPTSEFDGIVVQLSTNDTALTQSQRGSLTPDEVKEKDRFNKRTTYGAMEYIIALAKERYGCPIMFYTNHDYGLPTYKTMVEKLHEAEAKWGIGVLDLFNDVDVNNLNDEQKELYLDDSIHPSKAGYRDWWVPRFESFLPSFLETKVA